MSVGRANTGNAGEGRLMLEGEILSDLSEIRAGRGETGDARSVNQSRSTSIGEAR
jgi:hypothetical protein